MLKGLYGRVSHCLSSRIRAPHNCTIRNNSTGSRDCVRFKPVDDQVVYELSKLEEAGAKDALACRCGSLKQKRGICDEGADMVKCPTR